MRRPLYENAFRDYYRAVDARIGELLSLAGDNVTTVVVSDHGAKAMRGGLRINQWLVDSGYLILKDAVAPGTRIEDCAIDWPRTRVWSSGGYYARIFLNVDGREPQGCVNADDYERLRDEITSEIRSIRGPGGEALINIVLKPDEIYRESNGIPPDLLAYIDDLNWRAIGTVGHGSIYADENDTGPDDANHDCQGVFVCSERATRNGDQPTNIANMTSFLLSQFNL